MPNQGCDNGSLRYILVVDADPALYDLLTEWLSPLECVVVREDDTAQRSSKPFDLVIVDIPLPRQGGQRVITRMAAAYPNLPILALSSNFFAGIESNGSVARTLGVARVLPKPVMRSALIAAVRALLPGYPSSI